MRECTLNVLVALNYIIVLVKLSSRTVSSIAEFRLSWIFTLSILITLV